jgi:hypothetical protein
MADVIGSGAVAETDNHGDEIDDPRDADVLCGRGGAALRHPGNQTYRRLVQLNKSLYITCLKAEKLKISRSIVAAIREQNGRFLERNVTRATWYDIGDKKAIEKTSQALREGQPKLRQKIVELGGGVVGAAAFHDTQVLGTSSGAMSSQKSGYSLSAADQIAISNQNLAIMRSLNDMPPPHTRNSYNDAMMLQQQCNFQNPNEYLDLATPTIQEEPGSFCNNSFSGSNILDYAFPEPANLHTEGANNNFSNLSLLSDISRFQHSQASATPHRQMSGSSVPDDRRKHFAKMKFGRQPSSRSSTSSGHRQQHQHQGHNYNKQLYASNRSIDSMSEVQQHQHTMGSNRSFLSNPSTLSGGDSIVTTSDPIIVSNIFESRRSLMSGISRISNASDVHSIFSDLSRKIGNVSTRSIPMSEISVRGEIEDRCGEEYETDTIPSTRLDEI